jgi:hypothetical protein
LLSHTHRCNIKQTIAAANSVRVVVLINYFSLSADRGNGLRQLVKILLNLFGTAETFENSAAAMLVGVSRVPPRQMLDGVNATDVTLDDVISQLGDTSGLAQEEAKVVNLLTTRCFIMHPTDLGDSSWTTQKQLVQRIRGLTPIVDPSKIFETVLIADDMVKLDAIVNTMAGYSTKQMDARDFDGAANTFKQLFFLDRIGNTAVTQSLRDATTQVWAVAVTLRTISTKPPNEPWPKI